MPPLIAVALVVLCEGLTFGAVLPVLDAHCSGLGGGPLWLGVLFGLASLPKVVFNPLFGTWADRVGRRPMLALASAGTLAGSVGWALAPSIGWLALARLITGIFGAQAGLAQAVAADVSEPARRAAAVGLIGAAFGISLMFGPLVGGFVAYFAGTHAVGWACAVLQVLSLLIIGTLLRETAPPNAAAQHSQTMRPPDARVLRLPGVPILLVATLLVTIATSELVSTYSLVMATDYGFDERAKALTWSLFGLIGVIVQGGLIRAFVHHFGERNTIFTGLTLLGAGFAWVAPGPVLVGFWAATLLMALGVALVTPALSGLLSRIVSAQAQGRLAGLNQAVLGLGRFSGNLAGGALYDVGGRPAAYLAAVALTALAGAAMVSFRGAITTGDK